MTTALHRPPLEQLHDQLVGRVASGELAGAIALVARRGEVHVDVVGRPALDATAPLGRDAIFRMSSMTKPIVAAATLVAIEAGLFALDAPVDRWLPELANRRVLRRFDGPLDDTVPASRAITVRDLLAFTMGTGIPLAPPGATPIQRAIDEQALGQGMPRPQVAPPPDEWIRRLGTLPLMSQPGDQWRYHTGSDVQGVLIARAAGVPLEQFLRDRIFEPLGMVDTGFHVPAAQRDRLVASYLTDPTGAARLYDRPDGEWSRPPAFPSGGAGLVSTIDDYFAFAEMLAGGGARRGVRILSEASVAAMTRDQLSPAQKAQTRWTPGAFDELGWGFGVAVVTGRDPAGAPGAYGWDGGLGTVWRNDPQRELISILFTQHAWRSPSAPPVCRDLWTAAQAAAYSRPSNA